MARNLLNANELHKLPIGEHGDGNFLYFIVEPGKDGLNRRWGFRWSVMENGTRKRPWKKIGDYPTFSLKEARDVAEDWLKLVQAGGDPRVIAGPKMTLKAFIDQHLDDYKRGKSHGEVRNWDYAVNRMKPLFDKPIAEISVGDVVAWLRPIWDELPVTAERTLGKLSQLFDSAIALEVREKVNPASWKIIKATKKFIPARELQPVEHMTELDPKKLPDFMKLLACETSQNEISGSCLTFAILCALRSQEARFASWTWLNEDMTTFTIPTAFHKAGKKTRKPHIVPLATQVTALLKNLPRKGELIFPSQKQYGTHKPMADKALRYALRRVPGGEELDVHGFRSTFSQWTKTQLCWPEVLIEKSLAHAVSTKVAGAYDRFLPYVEERRPIMQAWADYATGVTPANVLPFQRSAA
jgi:integrase